MQVHSGETRDHWVCDNRIEDGVYPSHHKGNTDTEIEIATDSLTMSPFTSSYSRLSQSRPDLLRPYTISSGFIGDNFAAKSGN